MEKLKRMNLFEFEDMPWFPDGLRILMTRYISAFHRMLDTAPKVAGLIDKVLSESPRSSIIDLCSGNGGPILEAHSILKTKFGRDDISLILSDLYPNQKAAAEINSRKTGKVNYLESPLDAANIGDKFLGLRTMICSFHHMPPSVARQILADAQEAKQPIVVFEISDNSQPAVIWWLAIPFAFITTFFVTPLVRPFTFSQFVFTYIIPILPLLIAWDGAVSNARTYTLADMQAVLENLKTPDFHWEMGTIKGKGSNMLYLLGWPNTR